MTIQVQPIQEADLANAVIWDVRDPKAYQEGHLTGALNMPISKITADSLTAIPSHQPIYVLCGGGTRAGKAAALLESIDSSRQYIELKGGTRAAKAAGMPITVLDNHS